MALALLERYSEAENIFAHVIGHTNVDSEARAFAQDMYASLLHNQAKLFYDMKEFVVVTKFMSLCTQCSCHY